VIFPRYFFYFFFVADDIRFRKSWNWFQYLFYFIFFLLVFVFWSCCVCVWWWNWVAGDEAVQRVMKRWLERERGRREATANVEPEMEELMTVFERKYRPHLVMAIAIPLFQQLTGINIVAFYSPNLFQSVGLGHNATLLSSVVLGLVNLVSIIVSFFFVDEFGRRFLFICHACLSGK